MARYLHTMVRVADLERSRAFYEALGMEFHELTFDHDGRTYELGMAYGSTGRSRGWPSNTSLQARVRT